MDLSRDRVVVFPPRLLPGFQGSHSQFQLLLLLFCFLLGYAKMIVVQHAESLDHVIDRDSPTGHSIGAESAASRRLFETAASNESER